MQPFIAHINVDTDVYLNKNKKAVSIHMIFSYVLHTSFIRHPDYASASAARGQGVVFFHTDLTDLKSEKTAVFALPRLQNIQFDL